MNALHAADTAPARRGRKTSSTRQRAAAEEAWAAGALLLERGAEGAGLVTVGQLMRAAHSCRVAGLPRLSGAGARVAQHTRDLHARRPEFRLAQFAADVRDLLRIAHALRDAESADPTWVGAARRAYAEVGSLRLTGLFSEPVVSASGYAGVVTYLVDAQGTAWSLSDLAPGDPQRCQWAYMTPLSIGDLSVDHRSLSRGGLELEHATAAGNGRLGMGRSVSATSLDAGVRWREAPLAALWDTPIEVQLDRAWRAREVPFEQRRGGDDLVFVRGRVLGAAGDALVLSTGLGALHAVAPSAHAELRYRANLGALAARVGLELWTIGRVVYARPRTVALLAAEAAVDLPLPDALLGRVNLGLDTLPAAGPPVVLLSGVRTAEKPARDPLIPLRRRLEQTLLAGRAVIGSATQLAFLADEAGLARGQMPTAAELLRRIRLAGRDELALAWLGASLYLQAAESRLHRAAWLE